MTEDTDQRRTFWSRCAPALTLLLLAPMVSEILPGATRFTAIFALPVEMCVWGGGALMIRAAVRRWGLGWRNMLLLALALSVAEEWLIQQTSLAPMIFQLKGQGYARGLGVNYVYFLWALGYESVFVVFVPIYLVELIFPERRNGVWLSRSWLVVTAIFFVLGCFLAWFTWTQIARPEVFHVTAFNPPLGAVTIAVAAIAILIFAALGPFRDRLALMSSPLEPPPPWTLAAAGALWAIFWYKLVLLSFGIDPEFPSVIAVFDALVGGFGLLLWLPRWAADERWTDRHQFATLFGAIVGSILAGFIGFMGAERIDVYFKILADCVAFGLLLLLGARVWRRADDAR